MTPARYILLLLLISFFALIGVAQRARVVQLQRRVASLERETRELAEANRQLMCDISSLSCPTRIQEEVKRMNIALTDPMELSKATPGSADEKPRKTVPAAPH